MVDFSANDLYQIKVTLVDSKPPIWRRLVVPKTINLDELHMIIQLAMGWTNSHLYLFTKGNLRYGIKFEDEELFESDTKSSEDVSLKFLLRKENDKILYEYDFGDSWVHSILLEKSSFELMIPTQVPVCIKGKGTCPVEDSGGMWGYYQKLEEVRDLSNPERDELNDWLNHDIDERKYDLDAINERIASFYLPQN
ncbi:plasmid pRiA4b ORF-3 family protein [Erwinia mallotivora]|uniref:plasmid pRiA4b ORF-3 family protein n=1 Tax=Erwinia mallotivora TaxID=69222 RepID=UPI0035E6D1D9